MTSGRSSPPIAVVIPARNAAATLPMCLEAVASQLSPSDEAALVDDGSDDETRRVASGFPVRLVALPERRGVAAARNAGAAATRAPVLFFLDADVVLGPGGLELLRRRIAEPGVDAVIGSYDDAPLHRSTVSLFKNLAHHYFHQRSGPLVSTFWGACGAVWRHRFVAVGGFDERRYDLPSIEDVELGDRLVASGATIRLEPDLQVKHLKRWTFCSLVHTDVVRRAIPWTRLWLERGRLPSDLNFGPDQRLAAVCAAGLPVLGAAAATVPPARVGLALVLAAAVWVNRGLYRLFWRKGGLRLALGGFGLQQLYYLYAAGGLAAGACLHVAARLRRSRRSTRGAR